MHSHITTTRERLNEKRADRERIIRKEEQGPRDTA